MLWPRAANVRLSRAAVPGKKNCQTNLAIGAAPAPAAARPDNSQHMVLIGCALRVTGDKCGIMDMRNISIPLAETWGSRLEGTVGDV